MRFILSFLLFIFPVFSLAAEALPPGAITIKSDSMKYLDTQRKSVFNGGVVVTSETYTLKTDAMDVFFTKDNEINRIICHDNVNFQTEEIKASSDYAEIDQKTKIINLQGRAKLWQGKNYLEGEKVRINYVTKEIIADKGSKERVTVVFTPDNDTNGEVK
jgi:lipopolysaccharide export system protein LptA